jgi:signal transduction histidine kinase
MRAPLVALTLTSLLCLLDATPLWAQQHRVLTIVASRRDAPGSVVLDQVRQSVLTRELGRTLDYYAEHLDVSRFTDPDYLSTFRAYLKQKYADTRFDLVIAPTDASVDFLRTHRADMFPGVPVVFSGGPDADLGAHATGVRDTLEMAGSIELALKLQPTLRQVFVLSGTSSFDKYYEDLAREHLRRLEDRLSIVYWSGLTLEQALDRVNNLPAGTVLYALPFTQDASGQRFNPLPTLEAVTAAANVPVYHFSDLAMGHGVVGGAMNSAYLLANRLSELAVRVVRGERPDEIPVRPLDAVSYEVDWRQLQRWSISEDRLPPGTIVRFKEPGVWERYRWYIVAVAALVVLQSALIAGLVVQRGRRRRTEVALRRSEQQHRGMAEQNRDLAGRLITAQEAERTRIARDLHDDVSQRLAGVSIAFSGLKQRLGEYPMSDDVRQELVGLQQQTLALARNVRHLSHDLHPTVLHHLGLVKALTSYCGELERAHGVAVRCTSEGEFGSVAPDPALCVYRIAQEALRNVIAHAAASRADVRLVHAGDHVELTITDDGRGFDTSRAIESGRGLGLVSIRERAKIAGGTLSIVTGAARGTRIEARIPAATGAPRKPGRGPGGEMEGQVA